MLVVWDAPIKFGVSSGGGDFVTNCLHLRLLSAPQLNGWHQGSVISYAAANELPSSLSVYINCVDYRSIYFTSIPDFCSGYRRVFDWKTMLLDAPGVFTSPSLSPTVAQAFWGHCLCGERGVLHSTNR